MSQHKSASHAKAFALLNNKGRDYIKKAADRKPVEDVPLEEDHFASPTNQPTPKTEAQKDIADILKNLLSDNSTPENIL